MVHIALMKRPGVMVQMGAGITIEPPRRIRDRNNIKDVQEFPEECGLGSIVDGNGSRPTALLFSQRVRLKPS